MTMEMLLALGALVGMGLIAVLAARLFAQVRRLHADVAVVGDEFARVAAARERLPSVVPSQQKAHDGAR
jgi:hypothetical protein